MALTTVILRWRGPYTYDEVWESIVGGGAYLLTGRRSYERQHQIQYFGITEGLFADRICRRHHKLLEVRGETLGIWLGTVEYPARYTRGHLEIAEHCFVAFWQPALNTKKKVYHPTEPICLISQWYTPDGEPRRRRPGILGDLPDVLWWDCERWRTGRLAVELPAE